MIGSIELIPKNTFIIPDTNKPIDITYLALYLSPISPNKNFPSPYNIPPIDITNPISVLLKLSSEQIAGTVTEKF